MLDWLQHAGRGSKGFQVLSLNRSCCRALASENAVTTLPGMRCGDRREMTGQEGHGPSTLSSYKINIIVSCNWCAKRPPILSFLSCPDVAHLRAAAARWQACRQAQLK